MKLYIFSAGTLGCLRLMVVETFQSNVCTQLVMLEAKVYCDAHLPKRNGHMNEMSDTICKHRWKNAMRGWG